MTPLEEDVTMAENMVNEISKKEDNAEEDENDEKEHSS